MKSHIRFQMGRLVRSFAVVAVCVMMMITAVAPAYAIGSSQSKPSDGEARLQRIQDRSEQVLNQEPRSMKEVGEAAQGGLNEIQGASDYNKMSRPENSQDAESVPDQIKRAFDNLTQ
jgi:hypothetical protein